MKRFSYLLALALFSVALGASSHTLGRKAATPARLHAMQEKVWKEWVAEQQASDQLAPFFQTPLATSNVCTWHLPDSLEANADMHFYSGTKGERPEKGYPFFLYLHGSGPRDGEWATGFNLCNRFEDAPSMYLIPRIPNEGKLYRWWHQSKQWAWEKMLRRILVDPMVDPSRIYWFGISEGGYGSQRLASFYADYLAAAGPMAGGEPLRNAPAENLSHTPLSLITGEKDDMFYRNILTPRIGERLDSLAALYPGEYEHRVFLEEGHGHPVTYSLTTPWLSKYTRCAQPRHFRWENYEMHGRKRNAFYNLEVIQESDTIRHDYELTITDDNVVRLDVSQVHYIITEIDPYFEIELNNTRSYTAAPHGHVRIYLSEQLVNLRRPVTLIVNGGAPIVVRPKIGVATIRQALRLFGDPLRLFPAAIEAEW